MITEVIMKRELFGEQISQKSKSEFFSATDLVRAGNKWRRANELHDFNLSQYLNQKGTKEFIDEVKKSGSEVPVIKGRGRSAHTWVHPLVFIDIALAISPRLRVEAYKWLMDSLLRYRNDSGDSYMEMCGALYTRFSNHKQFPAFIQKVASIIKIAVGVKDWETATEQQLKLRDKIHNEIKTFCKIVKNPYAIVRTAVKTNTGYDIPAIDENITSLT